LIRILIADDHVLFREGLRQVLARHHDLSVVAEAGDGQEALDLIRSTPLDVVLLDISMPGMSGLELQETLQAQQIRIPIIFITGHGDVPMSVRALKAGALDFIEKPFNKELLLSRINDALFAIYPDFDFTP